MTNEEKAKELQLDCIRNGCGDSTDIRSACEEMAEWKDKQFKEYLEEKRHFYAEQMCIWRDCAEAVYDSVVQTSLLNTIINELFNEK